MSRLKSPFLFFVAVAVLGQASLSFAGDRAEAQAFYKQGLAHKRTGNLEDAIAAFDAAIKIDGKFTAALYSRGLIYKKQGDFEKAKVDFESAISSSSDYGPAHLSLGQILLQDGEFETARKEFDYARAGKEVTSDDKAEAWNGTGIAYRYEAKIPDAVKAFDEAIKISPKNWIYYVNKGIAINKSKDKKLLPEGEAAYRKAAELAPDKADTWMGVGISCRKQGKYDEAIVAYEKALKINPKDADGWYDLASMYMKAENYESALFSFEAYIKLAKPGSKSAEAAEAYIQQLKKKLNK